MALQNDAQHEQILLQVWEMDGYAQPVDDWDRRSLCRGLLLRLSQLQGVVGR